MIKVSIITVCFNSKDTIQKTIESVVKQTYKNIEYIIVDGKSKDGTLQTIEKYCDLYPGKITYISEEDNGIYDAMNKGIDLASGELIGILNSDDYYELDAVENMVNAMQKDKYQILYGFIRALKDNKEFSIDRQSHAFLSERMIGHPACFVTKSIYDDFGKFDLQYVSVSDYDFMLRMSRNEEIKFYPVNFLTTNFVLGGMSSTNVAWMDLLKLHKNYGMITDTKYKKEMIKNKIVSLLSKLKVR